VRSAKVSCVVNKPDMLADVVNCTSVWPLELHWTKDAMVYACLKEDVLLPKI